MPGIVIAGFNSGCGKTTVTTGILGALKKKGLNVQPFKAGPDYIDPMFHTFITGRDSRNLDAFMMEENTLKHLYKINSKDSDLSIVEGVMGLFDGLGGTSVKASTAHVAKILKLPVILVVNGEGMSLSIVPMLKGVCDFDPKLKISGIIINNIKSYSHFVILKNNIQEHTNLKVLGYLLKDESISISSRHLGLVPQIEIDNIKEKIDYLSNKILETVDLDVLQAIAIEGVEEIEEYEELEELERLEELEVLEKLNGIKIAVAMDKAFNFYYRDNLDLLISLGAEIVSFSPMEDNEIPKDVAGIYMGGGYPEVFAQELSENQKMKESFHHMVSKGIPIYAECGSLMYLSNGIKLGCTIYPMTGIIDVVCKMTDKLQNFGYINMEVLEDNIISKKGQIIRGHEFHYSSDFEVKEEKYCFSISKASGKKTWTGGYKKGNVIAGYPHIHFWSDTSIAKRFLESCSNWKNSM